MHFLSQCCSINIHSKQIGLSVINLKSNRYNFVVHRKLIFCDVLLHCLFYTSQKCRLLKKIQERTSYRNKRCVVSCPLVWYLARIRNTFNKNCSFLFFWINGSRPQFCPIHQDWIYWIWEQMERFQGHFFQGWH